jgi:hypothetical protein
MIHLQMNGFIADNLFQYVAARILAEDLGYALEVSHSRMHPRKNVPRLLELLAQFRHAPLTLPGKTFHAPVDYTAHVGHGDFDGYHLDLASVIGRQDQRKIEVAGYFQSYELLQPYKARIRSWFELEPCALGHDISADDIVIHVRQGDLVVFGWAISLSFYTNLLDGLTFRKLFICGYGLSDEVRRIFARYDPIYVHGEPVADFRFMKGFNRMIQSNSGFSWWAGFLSQASEIYAPVMAPNMRTYDPKSALADLRVVDEERFHYVYDVPYLERPYSLKDIFVSRGQLRKKRLVNSLKQLVIDRLRGKNQEPDKRTIDP